MGALYETWNPCFPLRRAFLLLFSWVTKPISVLPHQVFWVVVFHSFIWWFIQSCFLCSLFCTLILSWCLLLWKLSLKTSYLWTPANYQLFFDQELSLTLPIMIHFMYLYCVSFTYCKLSYIIVSCLLLWLMYWWMWCLLSVSFYRLFTP